MAKRKFELPGIQDLSKEQERALALGEGQHLIVGGPGTGKTVVALIRARRHQREGDEYVFLVYNHLLHRASVQLFSGALSSATWTAWFLERFEAITGEAPPREPARSGGFRPIDWEGVPRIAADTPPSPTRRISSSTRARTCRRRSTGRSWRSASNGSS